MVQCKIAPIFKVHQRLDWTNIEPKKLLKTRRAFNPSLDAPVDRNSMGQAMAQDSSGQKLRTLFSSQMMGCLMQKQASKALLPTERTSSLVQKRQQQSAYAVSWRDCSAKARKISCFLHSRKSCSLGSPPGQFRSASQVVLYSNRRAFKSYEKVATGSFMGNTRRWRNYYKSSCSLDVAAATVSTFRERR